MKIIKIIKKIEYIILTLVFLATVWFYVKMFFSSALMCFIIGLYEIFALETLSFCSLLMDDDGVIKMGYILFCLGAGILYLVYLHIG